MSYGMDPYDPLDEESIWTDRYADFLDKTMEAQYQAELDGVRDNGFVDFGTEIRDTNYLAHQVLHCPMVQPNDGDAATVGEFLGLLLSTLWLENEGFSGKRPLGNSDWQWQVYMSLVKAGLAAGTIYVEDGYEELEDWTYEAEVAADELILSAIRLAYNHGA